LPTGQSSKDLPTIQGFYYGHTTVVRISGNLNMANATSLANRIEAIFEEEEPEQAWLEHQVSLCFMC